MEAARLELGCGHTITANRSVDVLFNFIASFKTTAADVGPRRVTEIGRLLEQLRCEVGIT
jgi:hypothetical protein